MSDLVAMSTRAHSTLWRGLRLNAETAGVLHVIPSAMRAAFESDFAPSELGATSRWSTNTNANPFRLLDDDLGARLLAERDAALEAARARAMDRAQAEQAERERLAANEAEYQSLAAAVRAAVEENDG